MKTAMQDMIEWMEFIREVHKNDEREITDDDLVGIINEAKATLKKEKQQITNAYSNGSPEFFDLADDYYNQTYNQ